MVAYKADSWMDQLGIGRYAIKCTDEGITTVATLHFGSTQQYVIFFTISQTRSQTSSVWCKGIRPIPLPANKIKKTAFYKESLSYLAF